MKNENHINSKYKSSPIFFLKTKNIFYEYHFYILIILLFISSLSSWLYFSSSGLNLTYNDAMSHLDISRRVFDNITPGLTQLGSVWLPLPHLTMLPTIWNDYLWRSGLSAGIVSMTSYILTALITYKAVRLIGGNFILGIVGAGIIAINPNFFYLQTTALTEPLFIVLYAASMYYLLYWSKTEKSIYLIAAAFFIFLSTLTRYDGWFYLVLVSVAIFLSSYLKKGWQEAKGRLILFGTLAGFGVILWLIYNQLIFGNALYFAVSEFSAGSQQSQMAAAGVLPTKGDFLFSLKTYYYAMASNIGLLTLVIAGLGWLYFNYKNKSIYIRAMSIVFLAPIFFNVISLFLGQSVIYLPETVGNSWFNVRYGLIVLPLVAIFAAYLLKMGGNIFKLVIVTIIIIQSLSFVYNNYIITIIDGVLGSSQKNVKGLGNEIGKIAQADDGLILASAASHDAILFSSKIPMKRFIHEGTGDIWNDSLEKPNVNAEYIIMRTNDKSDSVARAMIQIPEFQKNYTLTHDGDYADFYQRTSDFKLASMSGKNNFSNLAWEYNCIDTMKHSRDLARESISDPQLNEKISSYIKAIKNTNANCVAIGTPYDPEFYEVLKSWVDQAHTAGLIVWFRGNWSGWEGWFDYPKEMTRDEHLRHSLNFVANNQNIFKDGDIFTACPECENGGPGNPLSNGDLSGFREFMIREHKEISAIFIQNNKRVKTNFSSVNADVAKGVFDENTVKEMDNLIVLDHYAKGVKDYKSVLDFLKARHPQAKIIFGEFGAPVPDIHGEMNQVEQAEIIDEILTFLHTRSEVIGINYWVGIGGSTAIFNSDFSSSPASKILKKHFTLVTLKGKITDRFNNPLPGIQVYLEGFNKSLKTNSKGDFVFYLNPGSYKLNIPGNEKQREKIININIKTTKNPVLFIKLESRNTNIQEWFKSYLNF